MNSDNVFCLVDADKKMSNWSRNCDLL